MQSLVLVTYFSKVIEEKPFFLGGGGGRLDPFLLGKGRGNSFPSKLSRMSPERPQ